jgi:hypothetical protein
MQSHGNLFFKKYRVNGSVMHVKVHTDRTRFGNANFQFSMAFNFNIFLCFSNIRNHLSNLSYLVCISCKIFIRSRFYLFLKTENSRRVVESRSVCMNLKMYKHEPQASGCYNTDAFIILI